MIFSAIEEKMKSRGYLIFIVLIALIISIGVIHSGNQENNLNKGFPPDVPDEGNFSAEYNDSRNILTLSVKEGEFTEASGKIYVKKFTEDEKRLNISGYGKNKRTNYWASAVEGDKGLTEFPLEKGERIRIHNVSGNNSHHSYGIYNQEDYRAISIISFWNGSAKAAEKWTVNKYLETWGYESIPKDIREELERNNISIRK
jgi:hypothetical protein